MNNDRRNSGYGRQNQTYAKRDWTPQSIKAEPLPENYVVRAEDAIIELKRMKIREDTDVITTSKLRSLFSLFTKPYNEITRGNQKKADKSDLSTAKVRIYYEMGRDGNSNGRMESTAVGRFVRQTKLLEYLLDIGDSAEKLIAFYHYMEALVAFHRFYFGEIRDKN